MQSNNININSSFEQRLERIVVDSNRTWPFTPAGPFSWVSKTNYKLHRENLRPVLQQIKTHNRSQLQDFSQFQNFFRSNLANTLHKPMNQNLLDNYYNSLFFNFRNSLLPIKYSAALAKIGTVTDTVDQSTVAHEHAINEAFNHPERLAANFARDRHTSIEIHQDLDTCVEIVSSRLGNLTNSELDLMVTMAQNHEQFAFVKSEPYLMLMFGNALFFSILLPLHRAGAFSFFMQACVAKQFSLRSRLNVYMHRVSSPFINYITPIVNSKVFIGSVSSFLLYGFYLFRNSLSVPLIAYMESTFIRDSINSFIKSGVGLENSRIDNAKSISAKLAFDFGSFVAGMSSSFIKGWLSRYPEAVDVAATAADKLLAKRKKD